MASVLGTVPREEVARTSWSQTVKNRRERGDEQRVQGRRGHSRSQRGQGTEVGLAWQPCPPDLKR